MPIVAVTGHRPDKLGGYRVPNQVYMAVKKGLRDAFTALKPEYVLTGMALGVDQWAAQTCVDLGIPFVAAVPFHGQESKWPPDSQAQYQALLNKAHTIYVISPGPYAPNKMHIRNQWMVDSCNVLVTVYNGDGDGGTAACVRYALNKGKSLYPIPMEKGIWELADKLNYKKQQQIFPIDDSKVGLSPFVGLIKQKAQEKALELALEAQEHQKKAFAPPVKPPEPKKPVDPTNKAPLQGFSRALDLDD